MANMIQDNIRSLWSQYNFANAPGDSNTNLTCILCKNLLNDAYQTYCGCQYCHECIFGYLKRGQVYCSGGKDECKDECLKLDVNVHRNAMLNRKIIKSKFSCPHKSCSHCCTLDEMGEHLRVCTKQAIECPYFSIGCDNDRASKDQILTHIHNETLPHAQLLIDLIHNLRNEIGVLKDTFKHQSDKQEQEIESLKGVLNEAQLKINQQEMEIELLKSNFNIMKESDDNILSIMDRLYSDVDQINLRSNMTGEFFFLVVSFDKWSKSTEAIFSPYFYSHLNGYKLKLEVHPGGFKDGTGTYLSVYFVICKGEYDNQLSWPCKYIFTVAMVDQRRPGATHNAKTMNYDNTPSNCRDAFKQPIMVDNIGYGSALFMSHTDMRSTAGVVVNNRIIIKCTASPPAT